MSKCFTLTLVIAILFLTPVISNAQYYDGAPLVFKIRLNGFQMSKTSFTVAEVLDERKDKSKVGEVYFGVLDHHIYCYVKKGIPKEFTSYFEKGLVYAKKGETPVTVVFKELAMNESHEDLYAKGGRKRSYKIAIDYYAHSGDKKYLVLQDSLSLDSTAKVKSYDLNKFCFNFFNRSFRKLDTLLPLDSTDHLKVKEEPKTITAPLTVKTNISKVQLENNEDSIQADTTFSGEIKVTVNTRYEMKFKPYTPNSTIVRAITEDLSKREIGVYVLQYRISKKDDEIISKEITPIYYKQRSVSPYWYITVPFIVLMSIISSSNG